MEHYVVVLEWTSDGHVGSNVVGVTHTFEEAKCVFNETLEEEQKLAEEYGWTIYEYTDTEFDAGEDGGYLYNHSKLYIQEVM